MVPLFECPFFRSPFWFYFIFRFISGKPLIDLNTVPRFVYRLDVLGGQGLEQLKAKIPQFDSIPSTAIGVQLESELPEIRDISSLLDILQTTVDTLALVGGTNQESLSKKIHQLKITSFKGRIKVQLPKSLDNFKLGHLEALMVNLRFVRAKRMVHNNHPPFHKADKVFYEPLPEQLLPSIDEMLHHVQPGQYFFFLIKRFSLTLDNQICLVSGFQVALKEQNGHFLNSRDKVTSHFGPPFKNWTILSGFGLFNEDTIKNPQPTIGHTGLQWGLNTEHILNLHGPKRAGTLDRIQKT